MPGVPGGVCWRWIGGGVGTFVGSGLPCPGRGCLARVLGLRKSAGASGRR